ncbi:hypothetical protein BCR34DRAFT_474306 [Clohesyomyces aquaticus]|uniref:polynucleotide adenylyltransferase n=1 Tax=Clohesyomyces aquaticus TaxID=1231657 RepID=A0A1Y2A5Q4_9PLEO|nr:hypothetical protein BCR34DRAFT_474306 [Clohesyomyces aquaticus]
MRDSYRPADRADTYRPRPAPPRGPSGNKDTDNDSKPSLRSRMTFKHGGGKSYAPAPSLDYGGEGADKDFTFRAGARAPQFPSGPRDAGGQARLPPSERNFQHTDRHGRPLYPRSSQNGAGAGQQGGWGRGDRRPFRKEAPHERPLISRPNAPSPERVLGSNGQNRFMDLAEIGEDLDSPEPEKKLISYDGNNSDDQTSSHKKARVTTRRADGDSVPQWSNPDPYTVAPPPSDTTGKKTDFVQLIRKAKNQAAEKDKANNAVAANDDFIAFDMNDDVSNFLYEFPPLAGSLNEVTDAGALPEPSRAPKRSADDAGLPPKPQHKGRQGKRKRGEYEGALLQEWIPEPSSNSIPWCRNEQYGHLKAKNELGKLLHNEILDFYDYVKPTPEDQKIRQKIVKRVESVVGRRVSGVNGRVFCFGSFPAGLYLPAADMDLVYVSDVFAGNGDPQWKRLNNVLWSVSRRLEDAGMVTPDSMQVITKAKVPIIKFVDSITGIQVDLSFENLTGIEAQNTFTRWKAEFPDIPFLVSLLKQFLVMRGLNEVHNGGLGGFSIICLTVSYLQTQPRKTDLGEMFLGILDLYGNKFNLARSRIVMDPPGHVKKDQMGIDGRQEKPDRLSIQDPNNPNNNISGGSSQVVHIFKQFAIAHKAIRERIDFVKKTGNYEVSILEPIFAGNYGTYEGHRAHIETLNRRA